MGRNGRSVRGRCRQVRPSARRSYLTSPEIDLSSLPASEKVHLDFWRYLNSGTGISNRIEVFDGTTWQLVWQSGATTQESAWQDFNYEVTQWAKHQHFRIRFGFAATNGAQISSSWNLDYVRLIRFIDQGC